MSRFCLHLCRDALSRHVTDADEAINIGSVIRATKNPFLDIELLVKTALSTGAHAVHPGYGYLSENPDFADGVRNAGLIFIGPTSQAMSTLGDKRMSKDYLRKHAPQVPLIPGFEGSSQNAKDLETAAEQIGYPVMLKASAGGGGKGIRVVREQAQLRSELERAQSEASRSFGSSDCILEKFIEEGKHLEIQIVGDSHGNVISLGERDCSVQRRHQKVIEETPCQLLTPETRQKMSDTAILIAKLIGYEGAGTVEFVYDVQKNSYYFLEVNARLQVEHPITEEVTGLDLVALQLYVAAGGNLRRLPAVQNITQTGHAIECRLCAEDPNRDFYPEHGKVLLWQPSETIKNEVRYETAMKTGSQVSIHFDSMIAKIVVWAPTRAMAIEKMVKVLADTVCAGVRTNQLFLQSCLLNRNFRNPAYITSFIQTNLEMLLQNPHNKDVSKVLNMLSVVPALYVRQIGSKQTRSRPFGNVRSGFRNQYYDPVRFGCSVVTVDPSHSKKALTQDAMLCVWESAPTEGSTSNKVYLEPVARYSRSEKSSEGDATGETTHLYNAISNSIRRGDLFSSAPHKVEVTAWRPAAGSSNSPNSYSTVSMDVSIDGSKVIAHLALRGSNDLDPSVSSGQSQRIFCHFPTLGTWMEYKYDSLLSYCESVRKVAGALSGSQSKTVKAPMPCKVLNILKKNGDDVKAGENVMVVESMKMEMSITMTADGKFETSLKEGDAVDEGKVLCSVV